MSRATRYYVDDAGTYLGGWQEPAEPPAGAIEVPVPPAHAAQQWTGVGWSPPPVLPVEPPRIEDVVAALEKKGVLTRADVDAEKERGK